MFKKAVALMLLVFIQVILFTPAFGSTTPRDPLRSDQVQTVMRSFLFPQSSDDIFYNWSMVIFKYQYYGCMLPSPPYSNSFSIFHGEWYETYRVWDYLATLVEKIETIQEFYLALYVEYDTSVGMCRIDVGVWDFDYNDVIKGFSFYPSGRNEIKIVLTHLGYTIDYDIMYFRATSHYGFEVYENNVLLFTSTFNYTAEFPIWDDNIPTDPEYYVVERMVNTKITSYVFHGYDPNPSPPFSGWTYIVKYYVPVSTPPPPQPPSEEPEEPIGEPVTVYYSAPPIVKMSISDAIRLGFYLYRKPSGVSDILTIYHYLTMREFRYKLSPTYEYYLITLTDTGETQKHRMILYNNNLSRVEGEYIFRSMDHFTLTCYNGELKYFFYRSRYGRSLLVREEKLINLGNEFIMYPLMGGVHHTFRIQSSRDELDLVIYMPYRFGENFERDDYMVRILFRRFYTENGYFKIMRSRLINGTYEYEYIDDIIGPGTFNVSIVFTIWGGVNESYIYINGEEYYKSYFVEPKPIIGRPNYSPISEVLLELSCKLTDPDSYVHFIVSTSTGYRIETTQFNLLPLRDFVKRMGYNETHFKLYLEFWMRPITNVEILHNNVTVKLVRDQLKIREGNCTYLLTHVYYDPSTGLYRSSTASTLSCALTTPLWTRGFESMIIQVEKKGFTITIYSPGGRRDYYTEIIVPNTSEYRQYSYQGFISAFVITNCIEILQYSSSKRLRVEPTFVDTIGSAPSIEKIDIPKLEIPDWWNIPGWISFIGNLMYHYLTILINFIVMVFSNGVVMIPAFLKMFGVMYLFMIAVFSLYNPSKLITLHIELFMLIEKMLHKLWNVLVNFAKLIASVISALKPF